MRAGTVALLVGLMLALTACAGSTRADRAPRADPVARLAPAGPSPWRETLGDPALADLLLQADGGGIEIKTALARLERAQAEVERAQASKKPRVSTGVVGATGAHTFSGRPQSAITPVLDASYEIDLWGRLARAQEAAMADRTAAAADVAAARLLIAAEVARAYTALRLAQAAETGAASRIVTAQQALTMMQERAANGAAIRTDVEARAAAVRAAGELAIQAREEVEVQSARIAALIGKPTYIPAPASPREPDPAPIAIASDVVDRRPDVQASLARLLAADQKRAEAVAATRPRFVLDLGLGSPEAALVTLLNVKSLAWAAAASLSEPLLDGGARRADLHATTADADLAELAYRQAVRTAWSEVRAAGVAQARSRRALIAGEVALAAARAAVSAGDLRHQAGVMNGIGLLDLDLAVGDAEGAILRAQAQAIDARIQFALVTGGG